MNSKKHKMEKMMNTRPPEWETKQYINVYDCKEDKLWDLFSDKLLNLSQNHSQMKKQEFINYYNDWKEKKEFLWQQLLKVHKDLMILYEYHRHELERYKMETSSLDNSIVIKDKILYALAEGLTYLNDTYLKHLKLLENREKLIKKKEESIDLLCEMNRIDCSENSLDVLEDLKLVQDFHEDKPRVSKVIQINTPCENWVHYEEVESLKSGNHTIVQVLCIEDNFIDDEIGGEAAQLILQSNMLKFGTFDGEPDIKYLIEEMDEDNENLMYDFTFLELEGKNPLNDRRINSGQFGYISDEDWIENYGKLSIRNPPRKKGRYKEGKNMTFIVIKMNGETNCRKDLLPNLQLIFDRGKEIWSFPTSILRWKHENDLQIINYLCKLYGLVIEIFLLLI